MTLFSTPLPVTCGAPYAPKDGSVSTVCPKTIREIIHFNIYLKSYNLIKLGFLFILELQEYVPVARICGVIMLLLIWSLLFNAFHFQAPARFPCLPQLNQSSSLIIMGFGGSLSCQRTKCWLSIPSITFFSCHHTVRYH